MRVYIYIYILFKTQFADGVLCPQKYERTVAMYSFRSGCQNAGKASERLLCAPLSHTSLTLSARPPVSTFISVGIAKRPSYNVMAFCVRRKMVFFFFCYVPFTRTKRFNSVVFRQHDKTPLYCLAIYLGFNIFNLRSMMVIEIIILIVIPRN